MYIVIDRFEGEYAILELENGEFVNVPKALLLSLEAREGDVLSLCRDDLETQKRKSQADELLKKLFGGGESS